MHHSSDQKGERRRLDGASILVLFAILITVIVIFVALVIDTSRLASAGRQKSHSADLVAMSFLEGYLGALSSSPDTSFTQNGNALQQAAFQAGLSRAAETGSLNFLTANRATATAKGEYQQLTQLSELYTTDFNQKGGRGHVRIGRWFSKKPTGLATCDPSAYPGIDFEDPANKCPCVNPVGNKPFGCFVACDNINGCRNPVDLTDLTPTAGNAARVDLYTSTGEGTAVKMLFGDIMSGPKNINAGNSGIAAVVPRHGVVLLDLSRSTTTDTHYQFNKNPNAGLGRFPAEFSFQCLAGGCTVNNDADGTWGICNGGALTNPNATPVGYTLETGTYTDDWTAGYNAAVLGYDPWCSAQDRHCKRDYKCVQVNRDGSGGSGVVEDFIVDIGFTDATETAPKIAQPHTSMLAAAHGALEAMYASRIVGDMVGFIGFDREVDTDPVFSKTNRYIPPTQVQKVGDTTTNYAGASDFQKMVDFTDPDPTLRQFRAEHNIFPRETEFGDLPLAIWHAHNMLSGLDTSEDARRFIVVVTSGLTSCARDIANRGNPSGAPPVCGRSYDMNQQSLDEMFNYRVKGSTTSELEGDEIVLHSIFVGSQVAPHRIFVKKFGSNVCLTEEEMRKANLYTTLPSTGYASSATAFAAIGSGDFAAAPYLDAAFWLSAAARQVGGLWVPVNTDLTRCTGADAACSSDDDGVAGPDFSLLTEVNSACGTMSVPTSAPPYPSPAYPGATGTVNVLGPTLQSAGIVPSGVDPEGRFFCDLNCSERFRGVAPGAEATANAQKALEEIYRTPPVSLVGALGN